MTNEITNRFADLTFTMEFAEYAYGVQVSVWLMADGSVTEIREDRGSTETISERVFSRNSEEASCYASMIAEAAA